MSILLGKAVGVLALAGLAATLAACGGEESAASEADAAAEAEAARIRLEQCLRRNGLDIKSEAGGKRTLFRADEAKVRSAMEKCRKYQQEAFSAITPQMREEFRDAFTKFAACMREHGVDVPDPMTAGPGAPGVRRGQAGEVRRIERASPKTQAAMEACQDKLPRGKGLAGPGIRLGGPG